ncbi:MAG: thioredoxin domain-containing protein, partial [Deltaproteobacteria bacterium]|nr:thioredoxin domain-containing protein [Deltaproteobacteria bacterium]
SMYVVQLAVAILAWRASPGGLRALVRSAADAALTFAWPMPLAAIVFSVALGASAVGFHYTKAPVLSRSLAGLAEPEPVAAVPAVMPASSLAAPPAQAPRSAAPAMSSGPSGAVDIPVGPGDYVGGNPSAAVTLVDFADFQCSYCRVLASEMTKLKAKYGAQVRFVFKHYPMNSDCNPGMSAEKPHEHACTAARAAHCAGEQGKFWEMHDRLYQGQDSLGEALYAKLATDLGLEGARFKDCLSDPKTERKVRDDVALGRRLNLNSTPSVFISGRIVRGLAAEILDYHIQLALKQPKLEFASVEAALPKPDHPSMVQARTAKGTFFIDAFEASIGPGGRAMSLAGATPAQLSWFEAKDACAKAGKRLCTEEEWVSACAGEPAVDNNGNGYFADDEVEGRMYPYGMLYERGRCRDDEDKYQGEPGLTGVRPGCRTPDGIYDLAGNLGEWVGAEQPRATVTGGDYRGGERSACNRRSATFGPGIRNNTIGFRCCADGMIEQPRVAASEVDTSSTLDVVGRPVPAFEIPPVDGQGMIASQDFRKNRLTYLTFFASWCGPCKRELPELKRFVDTYGPKGFRVVAVGEDRIADTSKTFAAQYQPNYPVAHDPDNVLMGRFGVDAMPASFLVDRKGVVRFRHEGFKPEEIPGIVAEIERLLAE